MKLDARRLRRLALAGLLLFLVVAAVSVPVWRSLFARVSSDGRLDGWVNRRPEKLLVTWQELRSPWPGRFEAKGLELVGHTTHYDWRLSADRATGSLRLPALLARQARFASVAATGVEFEVYELVGPVPGERPRAAEGAPAEGASAAAPPPPVAAAAPAAAVASRRPWDFVFPDVRLDEVRRLILDDRRFDGSVRAAGGFAMRDRRTAEVFSSFLELRDTTLEGADRRLATFDHALLQFRIAPWPYRGASFETVRPGFSGRVDLEARLAPAALLEYLFGASDWLHVDGSEARVEGRLVVDQDRLGEGTRLRLESDRDRVDLLGFEARGRAEVTAEVPSGLGTPTLEARLSLHDWELGRRDEPPSIRGDGLVVTVRRDEPKLDRSLTEAAIEVDLGAAHADDLGFVNRYLPASTRLRIASGRAEVRGRLSVGADLSGTGELSLRAQQIALDYGSDRLSGDVSIELALSDPNLRDRSFAVGGSRIDVRSFRQRSAPAESAPWRGSVELPSGRLDLGPPLVADAEFRAHLSDTSPIVALYDAKRDLPRWTERLLTLDSVQVSGRARIAPGEIALDRVLVPLPIGELRARLRLERQLRFGKLLLAGRRFAAGIELDGTERRIVLRRARDWFERDGAASR